MVIRGPGIAAGSTFDFIGSNVDVAPTFLALAGVDPATATAPPMDGKSIAHKLIDPADPRVPSATARSVRRELRVQGLAVGDDQGWRDHHWVEYNRYIGNGTLLLHAFVLLKLSSCTTTTTPHARAHLRL